MARLEDVIDPECRATLTEVDEWLREGRYTEVVYRVADIYLGLITARPEMIVKSTRAALSPFSAGRPIRPILEAWPDYLGAALEIGEDGKPRMRFDKERFMSSAAMAYFEYVLEATVRSQG